MSLDITTATATGLADRIRRGDLSPVTVVEACLDRIDARNETINAFVTVLDERAREQAKAADCAVSAGEQLGPLHGVPVAIKDLTNVAEVKTTMGSNVFADHVADVNDLVVQRLKTAGAIIIGKTNTPEFGRKPMTTNLLYGPTGNPWDAEKTAGGSSGGSAAAVADGMVPLAQGSDAAGSIRVPASACGCVGIMPDFGRVPFGPDRSDAFVNTHPYTYLGPITRSVADAALMLDVIAGSHHNDPFSLPDRDRSYSSLMRESLDGLTIAHSPDLGICRVSEEITAVVDEAVDALDRAGATVDRADPDFDHGWEALHDAIEVLLQERYIGMYDTFKTELDIDLLERRDEVTEEVISRLEKAQELSALDVRRAERVRTAGYDAVQALLEEYDLLVTPTLAISPFEKDTKPQLIAGEPIDPLHGWILTWPFNLTGNPIAAVPAGFDSNGLPVGIQIVGPRGGDDRVVAAAAAYERINPWAEEYPPS